MNLNIEALMVVINRVMMEPYDMQLLNQIQSEKESRQVRFPPN